MRPPCTVGTRGHERREDTDGRAEGESLGDADERPRPWFGCAHVTAGERAAGGARQTRHLQGPP